MKINKEVLSLIKKFEGFSPTTYRCDGGHPTIGFGHKLLPGEQFNEITEQQAEELLKKDVSFAEKAVDDLTTSSLTDNQFGALVCFVYNLGRGAFCTSGLLKAVNAGRHLDVPSELIKWRNAAGKPLKGLLLRRLAEATLYLS